MSLPKRKINQANNKIKPKAFQNSLKKESKSIIRNVSIFKLN